MFAPSNEAPPQAVLTNRSSDAVTPPGAENCPPQTPNTETPAP